MVHRHVQFSYVKILDHDSSIDHKHVQVFYMKILDHDSSIDLKPM
jgi:hypothetical protein